MKQALVLVQTPDIQKAVDKGAYTATLVPESVLPSLKGAGFNHRKLEFLRTPADATIAKLQRVVEKRTPVAIITLPGEAGRAYYDRVVQTLKITSRPKHVVAEALTAESLRAAIAAAKPMAATAKPAEGYDTAVVIQRAINAHVTPTLERMLAIKGLETVTQSVAILLMLMHTREMVRRSHVPEEKAILEATLASGDVLQGAVMPLATAKTIVRRWSQGAHKFVRKNHVSEWSPDKAASFTAKQLVLSIIEAGIPLNEGLEAAATLFQRGRISWPDAVDMPIRCVTNAPPTSGGSITNRVYAAVWAANQDAAPEFTRQRIRYNSGAHTEFVHYVYIPKGSKTPAMLDKRLSEITALSYRVEWTKPVDRYTHSTAAAALMALGIEDVREIAAAFDMVVRGRLAILDASGALSPTKRGEAVAEATKRVVGAFLSPVQTTRIKAKIQEISDGKVSAISFLRRFWRGALLPAVARSKTEKTVFTDDLPNCSSHKHKVTTAKLVLGWPKTDPHLACPHKGCALKTPIDFDAAGKIMPFACRPMPGQCAVCSSKTLRSGIMERKTCVYCMICNNVQDTQTYVEKFYAP